MIANIEQAFKLKNLKPIFVPQFEELGPKHIYPKIKSYYPEIADYFPEYPETKDYVPPKKYMWDVFSTFNEDVAQRFIKHAMSQRTAEEGEGDRTVEISQEVLDQLDAANYFSKKKGRALYMLASSKDITPVQRKRKRKFESYNPDEEKHQTKRMKKGDTNNTLITNWLVKKPKNYSAKESEDEDDNDASGMNIDNPRPYSSVHNPFSS